MFNPRRPHHHGMRVRTGRFTKAEHTTTSGIANHSSRPSKAALLQNHSGPGPHRRAGDERPSEFRRRLVGQKGMPRAPDLAGLPGLPGRAATACLTTGGARPPRRRKTRATGWTWTDALDWFDEHAGDPDLIHRHGLRPGQPLPPELRIFDPSGRTKEQRPRESVVRLPPGWRTTRRCSADSSRRGCRRRCAGTSRSSSGILHHDQRPDGERGQPWSPIAVLDAALADWPEHQSTREVTLAAAERDLLVVLDRLFPDNAGAA